MNKIITLALAAAMLSGCAQSSPEKHARHYALTAFDDLNPQFKTDAVATAKAALPSFQQAYALGQDYKKACKSNAEVEAQADYLGNPASYDRSGKEIFNNNKGVVSDFKADTKQVKAMATELKAAFLDGYYGR